MNAASGSGYPTYNGTPFKERWVVMLPGGYDRYGATGHGFWMIDAWTGTKYWEAWGTTLGLAGGTTGMDFSFASLPSLVPWGTSEVASIGILNKGFFDTALVGDTGGTLWTARFNDIPTFASNSNGESLASNWYVARAFHEADADDNGLGTHVYNMQHRNPFFAMPSLGRMGDSGYLRAYLGAGDRGNIFDQYLGKCSQANMLSCGKQGAVTMAERDAEAGDQGTLTTMRGAGWTFRGSTNAQMTANGTLTYSSAAATDCGVTDHELNACARTNMDSVITSTPTAEPQVACVHVSDGGVEHCNDNTPVTDTVADTGIVVDGGSAGTINAVDGTTVSSIYSDNGYYNAFYGVTVFKPSPSSRQIFNTASTTSTYDGARLTESTSSCSTDGGSVSGLCNVFPSGVLSNFAISVSDGGSTEVAESFNSPASTNSSSDGFYFRYPIIDEKTSSNTLLANGCLVWTSVQPTSQCASDADCATFAFSSNVSSGSTSGITCNTAAHECQQSTQCNVIGGSSAGHIYTANATDGSSTCSLVGTQQPRITFGTILPPAPPQQVALINQSSSSSGNIGGATVQYAIVLPAGQAGTWLQPKSGGGQIFRTFYELETTRALHDCRHNANCH
jgi:type IV pilus assembly protein PilY1